MKVSSSIFRDGAAAASYAVVIRYTGTILNYLWRKRVGIRRWGLYREGLTNRFASSLAVIERPGAKRVMLEVCCETKRNARVLVREFGGSFERLRKDWLQHLLRQAPAKPLHIGSRLVILRALEEKRVLSTGNQARRIVIPAE